MTVVERNPNYNRNGFQHVAAYWGTPNGISKTLSVVKKGSEFIEGSREIKMLGRAASAAGDVLGHFRLPQTALDAWGSFDITSLTFLSNGADFLSTAMTTCQLVSNHPIFACARAVGTVGEAVDVLRFANDVYQIHDTEAVVKSGSGWSVALQDSKKVALIKLVKAVTSVAATAILALGAFGVVTLSAEMFTATAVMSLAATLLAITANFYKETSEYKIYDAASLPGTYA